MSEIPPLNVEITFDVTGLNAGVAKATAGMETIVSKAKTTTESFGKFKEMALGVFGGNVLTAGVMGVTRFLEEMRNEVLNTQVALQSLSSVMDNMKGVTEQDKKAVEENAAAYTTLGFEQSEATQAMATLLAATGSITQSNKLMAMSADLARFKHIDMNTAARILARGTQGAAKAFKELGITLDTSIPKNQAIAKAFDELNKKIGGQAIAYTKTFAGQVAVLREKFQNIAETFATKVLPAFSFLLGLLSSLVGWVEKNQGALKVFVVLLSVYTARTWAAAIATGALDAALSALAFALESPIVLIAALGAGFVYLWNHWKTFRETMAEAAATVVQAIASIVFAHEQLFKLLSHLPKWLGGGIFKGLATDAENATKKLDGIATSIDNLKNKKITAPKLPSITGGVKPGDKTGITGNVPGGNAGGGSGTVQYVTVYASNTNDIYKKLSKAAKTGTPIGSK